MNRVYMCLCESTHYFCGGDDESKNIFTMQFPFIQTFSGVKKCTSCRQTFKHSTTQHTDSGFFIYTESDMLQ
jgi:hypothetical protein